MNFGRRGIEVRAHQHSSTDKNLTSVLNLIQQSFSYMDDRIDPPSSMHRLTLGDIAAQCETGEVWSIGDPVQACVFLAPCKDSLYVSKLAVSVHVRRMGLARELIDIAEERAILIGKNYLELKSRMELVEVHLAFNRLGFEKFDEGFHRGYERATYICMRKRICAMESSP